jgi:hypothetical protein
MAVRLKGMPSMPSGRREGMGPYEPSSRLRKRRWVRGVPTSRNTVAAARPGRCASTRATSASATASFFLSYSSGASPCPVT